MMNWLFSWLNRLLTDLFGIGSASVEVVVQDFSTPRGTAAHGTVILHGGRSEQHIEKVTVTLNEFSVGNRQAYVRKLESIGIGTSIIVPRDSRREIPFSILIPDLARLSQYDSDGRCTGGCRLDVQADIPGLMLKPRARRELNIRPHLEIHALKIALDSMGFVETPWYMHHISRPTDESELTVYAAPAELEEMMDGLSVYLQVAGERLIGRLVINWREKNLSERLRAMVGGNREQFSILIERKELIDAQRQLTSGGAIPYLRRILQEALTLKNNEQSVLLRPASAPNAAHETLLRPAGHGKDSEARDLLRAAEPPDEEQRIL